MATKKERTHRQTEPELDFSDEKELGPERAGLSGDDQGLPETARVNDESVDDLAAEGQPFEASIIDGVEEAADNPEQPVPSRSDTKPPRLDEADSVMSDLEDNEQQGRKY